MVFEDLNGKGRIHASRFLESRKAGKVFSGLSAWSRNVVTRTRPKQENLYSLALLRFGASLCQDL
jgi:hypothetical protein